MKTTQAFLVTVLASLFCVSAQAIITLQYNNDTGAYAVSGTAAGPGISQGSNIAFDWSWGYDFTFYNEVLDIFTAVVDDGGISGTVNGTPFVADGAINDFSEENYVGFRYSEPLQTGSLLLNSSSGTVSSGLWSNGDDTFVGNPGYSADTFNLEVGAVPEPSTYAICFGLIALGYVACRKRKA